MHHDRVPAAGPVLITERLVLRRPEPRDLPAWTAFFCSDRAGYVGGGAEAGAGHAWRAFACLLGHWTIHGHGTFVFTERGSDAALGGVGPWCPAGWPEAEIAWTVWSTAAEGRGYAAEAVRAALDHVFDDLGWTTAVSYVDPLNARSVALAERLGATRDAAARVPEGTGIHVFRHTRPERVAR